MSHHQTSIIMSNNKKKGGKKRKTVGIFGVRSVIMNNSSSSDSSDSDYLPDFELENEKQCNKKRKDIAPKNPMIVSQGRDTAAKKSMKRRLKNGTKSTEEKATDSRMMKCQGKNANWNSMPLEILVKIFTLVLGEKCEIENLPRFKKVCKQWQHASQHPSLWKKLDLSFMAKSSKANDKTLQNLASQYGAHILELDVSNWKKLTDRGLMAIAEMCQNLKVLNVSSCTDNKKKENCITANSIIEIIDKCNITSIDLSWLQMIPKSSMVMQRLMERRGEHLLNMNLCGCPVRSTVLNSIMAFCPNLRTLDISRTEIRHINVRKLQMSFPNLEELYMSSVEFRNFSWKDEGNDPYFEKLAALSVVDSNLSAPILHRLLKNASKLKLLDLRCCRNFTGMHTVTEIEATGVERLFLSFVGSWFMLSEIIDKWGNSLIELDLSWNDALSNEGLNDIAMGNAQMCKLEKLNLTGTRVEDEGVRYLISICPKLALLNLTSCKGVSRGYKHEHDKYSIDQMRTGNNGKFDGT